MASGGRQEEPAWEDDDVMIEEESESDDDSDIVIEDVTEDDDEIPGVEFVEAPNVSRAIEVRQAMAPMADADKAKTRDLYCSQGNTFFSKKQYKEATAAYGLALEADPYSAKIYANRAQAFLGLGQWQSALDDADECVRLEPRHFKGWYRLAVAAEKLGDFERALEACDTLSEASSFHLVVHKLRRQIIREKKKQDERNKIQSELRELCAEMTPEERRWKAWWGGQGQPKVVDNSNLDTYIPDAKSVDISYDVEVNKVLKGPDNLPRLEDEDEDDDDDILLEDILKAGGISSARAVTLFEDAGCGPRSLLTCLRLDGALRDKVIHDLLLPALRLDTGSSNAIEYLKNLAHDEAVDALAKSWDFDAMLKFPSASVRDLPGIGLENRNYSWRQKLLEIELRILLPPFTHANDLIVELSPRRLRVTLKTEALRFWPFQPNSWTVISDLGPQLPEEEEIDTILLPEEKKEEEEEEQHDSKPPESESSSCVLVDQLNSDSESDSDEEPIVEELPVVVEKNDMTPDSLEDVFLSEERQETQPRKLQHKDLLLVWQEHGLSLKTTEIKHCPPVFSSLQHQVKNSFGFEPLCFYYKQDIKILNDTHVAMAFDSSSEDQIQFTFSEQTLIQHHTADNHGDTSLPTSIVLLDLALSKKVLVDDSIWHISNPETLKDHSLQAPVLVLLLKKFQNLHKGTAAHHGELWWRHLFLDAGEQCPVTKPPTEFFDLK